MSKGPECQERAQDVLRRVMSEPKKYDQTTWQTVAIGAARRLFGKNKAGAGTAHVGCQTTGCVAGTASMLAGDLAIVHEWDNSGTDRHGRRVYSVDRAITPENKMVSIDQRGAELLCLTMSEMMWLFAGGRELTEVIYALQELADGKDLSFRYESMMPVAERKALLAYRVPPKKKIVQHVKAKEATPPKKVEELVKE